MFNFDHKRQEISSPAHSVSTEEFFQPKCEAEEICSNFLAEGHVRHNILCIKLSTTLLLVMPL